MEPTFPRDAPPDMSTDIHGATAVCDIPTSDADAAAEDSLAQAGSAPTTESMDPPGRSITSSVSAGGSLPPSATSPVNSYGVSAVPVRPAPAQPKSTPLHRSESASHATEYHSLEREESLWDMAHQGKWKNLTEALSLGRDPSAESEFSPDAEPVLHAVARGGNANVLRRCVDYGAPINILDSQKRSALHACALGSGDASTMEALLELGADLNARDWWFKTALDIAQEKGHHAAGAILRLPVWRNRCIVSGAQVVKGRDPLDAQQHPRRPVNVQSKGRRGREDARVQLDRSAISTRAGFGGRGLPARGAPRGGVQLCAGLRAAAFHPCRHCQPVRGPPDRLPRLADDAELWLAP